jgi:hypothetical protein
MVCRLLEVETPLSFSSEYLKELPDDALDCRDSIHPKKKSSLTFKPYYQVFEQKYGFRENLSCIDLLFNMGPEAVLFLSSKF